MTATGVEGVEARRTGIESGLEAGQGRAAGWKTSNFLLLTSEAKVIVFGPEGLRDRSSEGVVTPDL